MVGVLNDTDAKIDVVSGKHVGAQLSYSNDDLGVYLNYIGGKDAEMIITNITDEGLFVESLQ